MAISDFRIFRFKTQTGFKVMVGDREQCKVIAIARKDDKKRELILEVDSDRFNIHTSGQVSTYNEIDINQYSDEQMMRMIVFTATALQS